MSQNFLCLPPLREKFDIEQMSRNWKFWLRSFKLHARANNITDDGRKVALLLDRAGRHAQTLFYSIAGPNADEKTLTKQLLCSMQNSNVSLICCTNEVYFLLCDSKKRNRSPSLNCVFVKRQTFVNTITLTELIGLFLTNLFLICTTSS